MTHLCQCFTIAVQRCDVSSYFTPVTQDGETVPSVESTIVPSKSERTPSNVWTCGGAEKDPVAAMVGEGLLRGSSGVSNGEEVKYGRCQREKRRWYVR